jgi:glycosyltransferase involved in cell wall biosynthesis
MARSVALIGLVAAGSSGVARYTVALTRALGSVAEEFPDLRLRLVTTTTGAERVGEVGLQVDTLRFRARALHGGPARIVLEQCSAATVSADLLHFFDLSGPVLAPRRPFVTTMHDASVALGYNAVRYAYKRRLQPWALRRARATVAISEFAKAEATRHHRISPDRISVIHSGPGLVPLPNGSPARDFGLDDPYFLYVGNLAASKNLPFLVRAFERSELPATLVLVGRPGDRFGELREAVAATRTRVQMIHDADDHELDGLYRGATALLLPSRYEGFAFTPLEAMARGCPVLASDIPAVREISGGGAMLLPLNDELTWAAALKQLTADGAAREALSERGSDHVARYSWQATARQLCGLFSDVSL